MAEVGIHDIRKSYGGLEVIHGLSFDIRDREFVALVGPSGCGKSTLLRMIAGLESITGGDISIGSRIINDLPPKERDVAMVFQSYALYPNMTVAENMGFALRLARTAKGEIDRRVREAAAILGLDTYLDRYPRHLSGGQRQRVAMGRAIVRDPALFLFDEPLSNLDAKLRVQMRTELKSLHQKLQTTTVYVTHDQIEAMTMAHRIVVMNAGRIEQIGTPLELYQSPRNLFVAGFIGSPAMNLMEGDVVRRDDGLRLASGTLPEVRLPEGLDLSGGTRVVLGFRPEHIRFVEDGISATVGVVEPTGPDTLVTLDVGGKTILALLPDFASLRPEETVHIAPDLAHAHVFDATTGDRLSGPAAGTAPRSHPKLGEPA